MSWERDGNSITKKIQCLSTFDICPEDLSAWKILEETIHCKNDARFKELIDIILQEYVNEYNGSNEIPTRNVLIQIFVNTYGKKNLRKYIFEKLNSLRLETVTLFEYIITHVTNEIKKKLQQSNIFNIRQTLQVLNFLFSYQQNIDDAPKFEYLLQNSILFYLCVIEVFANQLFKNDFFLDNEERSVLKYDECYAVLDSTLKQFVFTVTRTDYSCISNYSTDIIRLTYEILKSHMHLKFETGLRCSLLFSYFLTILPEEEKLAVKWKTYPMLDFILNGENNYDVVLKSKRLKNIFENDTMKVILNISMYNSIDINTLMDLQIEEKSILEFLYLNLIQLGQQMTSCVDQIVQISKAINKMAKHLIQLKNFEIIFYTAYTFSWTHLDHFIEPVVTAIKSFLKIIVLRAVELYEKGETQFLVEFFKSVTSMSMYSKVRISALSCICEDISCYYILNFCPNIQIQLLTLMTSSLLRDMAGHVYMNLMEQQLNELPEEEYICLWLHPVFNLIKKLPKKQCHTFEEIITFAFKSKPTIFSKLFTPDSMNTAVECVIILKCIHFARMKGLVICEEDTIEYWRRLIEKSKMELFMIHQDEEVRLSALQALAECQKTTEEFTSWELNFLVKYFEYNVTTQVPSTRNKTINFYKKIFVRYQSSYSVLMRKITNLKNRKQDLENELETFITLKDEYNNFTLQFVQMLLMNLHPDANYSRRSVSLELLIILHGIYDSIQWISFFSLDDVNNLKHLLNDSYEGNKIMAVKVLKTLPATSIGFNNEENTRKFFEKCLTMACDIHPSQSLSACYMFQLILHSDYSFNDSKTEFIELTKNPECLMILTIIEKIQEMFQASNEDVMEAAKSTPCYGLLLSIKKLLSNRDIGENNNIYANIFNKLAKLCLAIKTHIMPIVCNSSPEGHIPTCDERDDHFLDIDLSSMAQIILVYSWKTMKEIMLLLAELVNQTIKLESVIEMLSEEYLLNIGDFFMEIFIQTKHRGVFEQAHVAFSIICRSFIRSKNQNLNNLPSKWLQEAIDFCTGEKVDDRLCATRRSAGLPFLILSIAPSLAETDSNYLQKAVEPLLCIANNTDKQQDGLRMHCLNVLRFMFNNSQLSDMMAFYIDRGTIAALLGFKSAIWGVRNSSTLLLSTLIIKIFGVPRSSNIDEVTIKNRLTLSVFYTRYPKLLNFLLKILSEECEKSNTLILHPVLLILSRLYPCHNENINIQVEKHIPNVNICIANPSYRTRDLAARASVSLISEHLLGQQLSANFKKILNNNLGNNEYHGLLLQVHHILNMNMVSEFPISEFIEDSIHLLSNDGKKFSHLTISLYVQIIFELLKKSREEPNVDTLKKVVILLFKQTITDNISTCKTSFIWRQFQLLTFILINKLEHVSATYKIITCIILKSLYGTDNEMKKRCLQFLIYINQVHSDDPHKEHSLIISEDVEICPSIKSLIDSFDYKSRKELLTHIHSDLISFLHYELKARLDYDENQLIFIFLLLRFYPCFFETFNTEKKQNILDWLLSMCDGYKEEIKSAIISCLKAFLLTLSRDELKQLDYTSLILLLMESASPGAADFRRLTVAQFLLGTHFLYKYKIFTEFQRYNILNVIMILLEDEEQIIRNTISAFPAKCNDFDNIPTSWDIVPHEARYLLLKATMQNFSKEVAICCLVSWALRHLPETSSDSSEVYERGELNLFAENIPIILCAGKVLYDDLWHSNQDEEPFMFVTKTILNSLIKIPSPMMNPHTKSTVINVFKSIVKFIEKDNVFKEFNFFNNIMKMLQLNLKTDYNSVKSLITFLYKHKF